VAVVEVGSFLATPYAFHYDMPTVSNAVLSCFADRDRRGLPLTLAEIASLAATFVLPLIMPILASRVPFRAPVLIACFALLCRSARRARVPE
jgi:hypothetical protein